MRISDWSSDVCSSDLSMAFTAARTAFTSAVGRRWRLAFKGRESVRSSAISSGSSRWTARGFSYSARRKASRKRLGMLSDEASWWVYLVNGAIIETKSSIWKGDRKSGAEGKRVEVGVDTGGRG